MWNRHIRKEESGEIFNVYGHTIVDMLEKGQSHLNIDTGAFLEGGCLTVLKVPEMKIIQFNKNSKKPLIWHI